MNRPEILENWEGLQSWLEKEMEKCRHTIGCDGASELNCSLRAKGTLGGGKTQRKRSPWTLSFRTGRRTRLKLMVVVLQIETRDVQLRQLAGGQHAGGSLD